jgi:hypothetical protein
MFDHHLGRPDRALLKRRREDLHEGLAEVDGLGVGIFGLHRSATAGRRHEFARHVQAAVLGLEHGAHMREILDSNPGREAALAAFTRRRAEGEGRHFGVGVLVDEERERLEVLRHLWRHAHGQRHERRVLGGSRNFEHDHAVLGLNGAIPESLLLERGPISSPACATGVEEEAAGQHGGGADGAFGQDGHGTILLRWLRASYHSHSSSAKAALTLRT